MSYADTTLINCNRQASVQAKGKNNTNPAIFTNTLNQTVDLEVGDTVNVERAFINELGAGNQSTIEFKGETRGEITLPPWTHIAYLDQYTKTSNTYDPNYRLGYYRQIVAEEVRNEKVYNTDNSATTIIGMYFNGNEYPNWVSHPRRFLQEKDTGSPVPADAQAIYTTQDSIYSGTTYQTINPNCYFKEDWRAFHNPVAAATVYKQKIDNSRYTLFVRNGATQYVYGNDGWDEQFPNNNIGNRDGIFRETEYIRYRDKLVLNVNKGFNTPSAVAEQITEQMQEIINENSFEIEDGTGFLRKLTKIVETRTFQSFNAMNFFHNTSAKATAYFAGNNDQDAVDYIATYAFMGVKRSEIFEEGRNTFDGFGTILPPQVPNLNGVGNYLDATIYAWEGFQTFVDITKPAGAVNYIDTNKEGIITNVIYNKENIDKINLLLLKQGVYEELWEGLDNTPAYSSIGAGVLPVQWNSRFFHINPYSETVSALHPYNLGFGDDGYTQGLPTNREPRATIPVFFKYDIGQKDIYIEPEDFPDPIAVPLLYDNTFSGGFAQPYLWELDDGTKLYYIKIRTDLIAGIPYQLFSDNPPTNTSLLKGRRIGYDWCSTSYGTAIATPHSGYSNADLGTHNNYNDAAGNPQTQSLSVASYVMRDEGNLNNITDIKPYMTQTYIGANVPTFNFNLETNKFEFQKLHTGNNAGNKFYSGCTADSIMNNSTTPPDATQNMPIQPPPINVDAGDTIYKINPRPKQFGYSPVFKPYTPKDAAYRVFAFPNTAEAVHAGYAANGAINTQFIEGYNRAIEPYKVFDSQSGIYFDFFGYNEEEWEGSMWDILGFEYLALQYPVAYENVLLRRVEEKNLKYLHRPTTNAEVLAQDTKLFVANYFGANMYNNSLPYPAGILAYISTQQGGGGAGKYKFELAPNHGAPLSYYPQIEIKTESINIEATNLPKSVLKPYYTIRSSILEGFSSIGGEDSTANLPIISIIDKYSAQNDYFLGSPSSLTFTITKPMQLADITTSIHDPDGSFALVNENSAIIYRITKLKQPPQDIIQQLIQEQEKVQEKLKKNNKEN